MQNILNKINEKISLKFFGKFTVNRGLNARATTKFADQLASTAILEAGTR